MQPDRLARLAGRAQQLKKLAATPGWDELRHAAETRRDKWALNLANDILRKGSTIDQRQIDWQAGFLAGCDWLLDNPDAAETTLEEALRRAQKKGPE